MLPLFDRIFGDGCARRANRGLCAIGFEGNIKHVPRLKRIEACYRSRGWRAYFLAPFAVGTETNSSVFFYSDPSQKSGAGSNDWGAAAGGSAPWHAMSEGNASSIAIESRGRRRVTTLDVADVLDWLSTLPGVCVCVSFSVLSLCSCVSIVCPCVLDCAARCVSLSLSLALSLSLSLVVSLSCVCVCVCLTGSAHFQGARARAL